MIELDAIPGHGHRRGLTCRAMAYMLVSSQRKEVDARKNERDRDEKLQALEKRVSDLLELLNQEKQAHGKQVLDLTSKFEECCGGAKGGSASYICITSSKFWISWLQSMNLKVSTSQLQRTIVWIIKTLTS